MKFDGVCFISHRLVFLLLVAGEARCSNSCVCAPRVGPACGVLLPCHLCWLCVHVPEGKQPLEQDHKHSKLIPRCFGLFVVLFSSYLLPFAREHLHHSSCVAPPHCPVALLLLFVILACLGCSSFEQCVQCSTHMRLLLLFCLSRSNSRPFVSTGRTSLASAACGKLVRALVCASSRGFFNLHV